MKTRAMSDPVMLLLMSMQSAFATVRVNDDRGDRSANTWPNIKRFEGPPNR